MGLARFVGEGELRPYWYAYSYYDFDRSTKVCYPILLNFLVRWWREFRFWFWSLGLGGGHRERIERAAYLAGRQSVTGAHEKYMRYLAEEREIAFDRGFKAGRAAEIALGLQRATGQEES